MLSRRILYPLIAIALAVALWWLTRPAQRPAPEEALDRKSRNLSVQRDVGPAPAAPVPVAGRSTANESPDNFPLVAALNAPESTIARDLDALGQILDAWRTNFPREGNPVGENHEITAALLGGNRLKLALLPENHPAINARGELCDRWGTPFRFHQLSGERMEIISAGPDRKFGTADDTLWSPGS